MDMEFHTVEVKYESGEGKYIIELDHKVILGLPPPLFFNLLSGMIYIGKETVHLVAVPEKVEEVKMIIKQAEQVMEEYQKKTSQET